jgi:polyhydroxyalkanoate synthase subunit PhaC
VAEEAKNRANNLLAGILRYIETPYARNVTEPAAIWRCGNARLLDYGATADAGMNGDRPVVLFVPSLINRYYILDLEEERSMLRYMATQGIYPLVLDWGAPGAHETNFDCSAYITEILEPAITFISKASGGPITLAGYCMGGVMTLAAALRQPKQVSSLALFATPWDFGCKEFAPFVLDNQWLPMAESMIRMQQSLPADIIQSLFYLSDPWVFEQKFRRFYALQPESRAARDFIALEHWVNDGVPMTSGVAQDCLIGWAQQNQLMKNQWKVAGKAVNPAHYNKPCFIAIPRNDHVVPFDCATPLASTIPNAHVIHPGAGHVGMIVGSHAKRELWQPLAEWLQALRQ